MAPKTSKEREEERRSILKVVTNTIRERKKKVYQGNQKKSLFALAMVMEDGQYMDDIDVKAIGSMDGIDVEATGSPVPRCSAELEKAFQKIEDAAKRIARNRCANLTSHCWMTVPFWKASTMVLPGMKSSGV